ncbi:ankyrin repeat domain-containing protein 50-like isoform X2 [Haliotis rufescens]|uniref:ankyrin repeat domain-containing protein 50-like isoform X2 n=1 Tax=Haliotis rufescens TaxID=6454 RepID=UPI00201F1141|nr:ankyrin repeat domain-containing protein 50-like isoform X2 [Haliotis rufescens]
MGGADVKIMLSRSLLFLQVVLGVLGRDCPVGKYGEHCQLNCSRSCFPDARQDVYCDRHSGRCSEGCLAGRFGDKCHLSCSRNCGRLICSQQTGYCTSCKGNNTGDFCETTQESCQKQSESKTSQESATTPLVVILVPVFAIIIIIIIIIIMAVLFMRHRKSRCRKHDSSNAEGTQLLEGGADTDLQTPDTDLIAACREGNLQRVRNILDQRLEDINKKDCGGMTPVMWAARRGHREVLDLLVKKGADVSVKDKDGHNILHWACYGSNFAMVKYVLSLGKVDINNTGQDGRTPAMFVARQGYRKLFQLLVSKGGFPSEIDKDGNNILILACWGGNEEIVKYMLSHKTVDINGRGQSNRTPLMAAAYRGNEKVVDLLVKEGADLTLLDAAGDNVLHVACLGGYEDIVKRVVDLVDISRPGQYNRTPLMMAARRGEKEIFELLVEKKAASCVDDDGNNILHLASEGGHLEIVKSILEKKDILDIHARNKHNETAAMLAPRGSEVSDLLVSRYKVLMK